MPDTDRLPPVLTGKKALVVGVAKATPRNYGVICGGLGLMV